MGNIFDITKSIILILVFLSLCVLGYFGYEKYEDIFGITARKELIEILSKRDQNLEDALIKLSESVIHSKVEVSTDKLEKKINSLDQTIIQLIEAQNKKIESIGETTSLLDLELRIMKSNYHKNENDPRRDYDETTIYHKDTEGKDIPIGIAQYNPNLPDEDKWLIGTYPLEYKTKIITSTDKKGNESVTVEGWIENNFLPESEGKKYPISLRNVEWVKRVPRNKSFMFNPRLSLNVTASDISIYPSIGISAFSYGKTTGDMDWRFLEIGIGGNKEDIIFHFSPAEYNIGKQIPIIENLFIGPMVNINEKGEYGFGGQISIPF